MNDLTSFKGDFLVDAPAVGRKLTAFLSPTDLELINCSWQNYLRSGTADLPALKRDSSSFNPRPARLIALLIEANPAPPLPLLLATFLLDCEQYPEPANSEEMDIAIEISMEVRSVPDRQTTVDSPINDLFLADLLDKMRHLHQSEISIRGKRDFILRVKHILEWLAGSYRLKEKLAHSLRQQGKLLPDE